MSIFDGPIERAIDSAPPTRRESILAQSIERDAVSQRWPGALEHLDRHPHAIAAKHIVFNAKGNKLKAIALDDVPEALPRGQHTPSVRRLHWQAAAQVWSEYSTALLINPRRPVDEDGYPTGECCSNPSVTEWQICRRCGVGPRGYVLLCPYGAPGYTHPLVVPYMSDDRPLGCERCVMYPRDPPSYDNMTRDERTAEFRIRPWTPTEFLAKYGDPLGIHSLTPGVPE